MTKNKKAEEIAFSRCDVPERTKRFALQYVSEAYAGIKNCRECEFYNTCIRIDSVRAELRKKKKEGMKNMTEQETREKIVGIITHEYVTDKDYAYIFDPRIEEKINNMADALIAAGIGDVKDVEAEANRYEMLYKLQNRDMALAERRAHDVEHRAEVAERALKNACEDVKETVSFLIELSERVDGLRVEGYLPEESEPKAYINRAEKELAEEGKDD